MRRFLPKTLAGQFIALLLGALVVTQVVAALFFFGERHRTIRNVINEQVMLRTAGLAKLVEQTPPGTHPALLRATSSPFLRFRIDDAPAIEAGNGYDDAAALRDQFAAMLDPKPAEIRLTLAEHGWWDSMARGFQRFGRRSARDREHDEDREHRRESRRRFPAGMQIALKLPDGRWLNARAAAPRPPRGWGLYGLFTLGLFAALVVVIVIVSVRRIARPMRRLAGAADAFGRGAAVEALPEDGPAEVRRATQAFNTMRERIDRFVQDRTRMLAAISHDLRTPISALRIRAEFVEDEALRAKMLESLEEMQRMTEETLSFLREDASTEPTRVVDVAALAASLADDLADLGHDVTATDAESLVCRCRSVALKRALTNLVMNAVRYGQRARIAVAQEGDEAVITIDDDGPGIPPENMARVFEPFVRLEESRSQETGGLGLGLAIARSIVRGHGGEIALENRAGGGLRATVRLPLG
jgi:signal transduction histidine kinase